MKKKNKINIKKQLKSKKIYRILKEFKNNHYKLKQNLKSNLYK